MKILLIGLELFKERGDGLNRYVSDCNKYLPKMDARIDYMVSGTKEDSVEGKVRIRAFAKSDEPLLKRWYAAFKCYRKLIVEEQIDIVVSHFCLYSFPLIPFIKLPYVVHFHGPWTDESYFGKSLPVFAHVKRFIEKASYKKASALIVLSSSFRDILHERYDIALERIHVIPGGTDIQRFDIASTKAQARDKLGLPKDRPVIFCIRRLTERMGIEHLIAAMKDVHKHHPDAVLYIAGKGHLENTLRQQIKAAGLSESVKLLGFVEDDLLPYYYRAATLSVVPTQGLEGFGLIIVESMAAGTPVMGTPVGGIPDILQPLSQNCLFKDTSSQSIAEGLGKALSDPMFLPDAEMCLQYTKDNFDWNIISQKLLSVYEAQRAAFGK
ncbi:MAG: glycosyl transferase family 1 [Alphaproteobacteria bacterium]|nr:MAG: glycosyl transferase family 1 [Alphaproteobacteria bacterium]